MWHVFEKQFHFLKVIINKSRGEVSIGERHNWKCFLDDKKSLSFFWSLIFLFISNPTYRLRLHQFFMDLFASVVLVPINMQTEPISRITNEQKE